jgi:hypothetical protein
LGRLSINIIILFLFKYIHLFLERSRISTDRGLFRTGIPAWRQFLYLTQIMCLVDAPARPVVSCRRKLFRGLTAPTRCSTMLRS